MASKVSNKQKRGHSKRPAVVTILGWLLLLQTIEMFLLGIYHFNLNNGPQLFSMWLSGEPLFGRQSLTFDTFFQQLIENATNQDLILALVESAALFLLTIFTLSAAIGFFRLWRVAWIQAMCVQGASLFIALILYFLEEPLHIYLLMISGIFMVLYLNYADVQTYFQTKTIANNKDMTHEH